jgi:hypothetical protein
MNLKEKLEGYKKNNTILLLSGKILTNSSFGKVDKVGDDYIVFRQVIHEEEIGWLMDVKYKYSGTTVLTIPFTSLIFTVHPRMEWAQEKFKEAESNDYKRKVR